MQCAPLAQTHSSEMRAVLVSEPEQQPCYADASSPKTSAQNRAQGMLEKNKTFSEQITFSAGRKVLTSTTMSWLSCAGPRVVFVDPFQFRAFHDSMICSQLVRAYLFPFSADIPSLESELHLSHDESDLRASLNGH